MVSIISHATANIFPLTVKVQQLEQELQWALVIEIEKVIYHLLSYWVDTHSLL